MRSPRLGSFIPSNASASPPPQSSSLLAWRSTSRPINSQVLYADRMVGAVRDAQDPVDLKKLGRGERKLQAEEKEAQRVIWKLQQLADGHAGGGVPELDTLKSLTPSELKLLATKCGEQGLDRTHTAIAHSLFWWIQSCGGVSFAVSIGVGRVWTGPSRKPAKAVEAPYSTADPPSLGRKPASRMVCLLHLGDVALCPRASFWRYRTPLPPRAAAPPRCMGRCGRNTVRRRKLFWAQARSLRSETRTARRRCAHAPLPPVASHARS